MNQGELSRCVFRCLLVAGLGALPQAVWAQDAFWRAVEANDLASTRAELARGADPNATHLEKGPAIVAAVRVKAFDVARLLASLDKTQVDQPNASGETALMLAALHGERAMADLLIQRGAQVNRQGWTPLHYAATGGQLEMLRWLLDEHHAFIDAQSPNGTTPLMMAARMRHLRAVGLLMEQGADPTLRNQSNLDATAYLERSGEPEAAAWMRERALRYIARYGTVEQPRWTGTGPPGPGQPPAEDPAAALTPIPMRRDPVAGVESGGSATAPAAGLLAPGVSGMSPSTAAPAVNRAAVPGQAGGAAPAAGQALRSGTGTPSQQSPRPPSGVPTPAAAASAARPGAPSVPPTPAQAIGTPPRSPLPAAMPAAPSAASPTSGAPSQVSVPPSQGAVPPSQGAGASSPAVGASSPGTGAPPRPAAPRPVAPVGAVPPAPVAPKPPQAPEPADSGPVTFSRTLSLPADPPSGTPGTSQSPQTATPGSR